MDDIKKESEFVLKHMYKIYLDRLEDGEPETQSKYFGSCEELQKNYFIGFSFDKLHDCINELSSKNYLKVSYGDNVPCSMILENKVIVYFEYKYSKNIKSLIKDLSNLKNLLSL